MCYDVFSLCALKELNFTAFALLLIRGETGFSDYTPLLRDRGFLPISLHGQDVECTPIIGR
jgi:hypothetical protein